MERLASILDIVRRKTFMNRQILRVCVIGFFLLVLGFLSLKFFSPLGSKTITTDFSESQWGISRLFPENSHSGFLYNYSQQRRYHELRISPARFNVKSHQAWRNIDVGMTYDLPAPGDVSIGKTEVYPKMSVDRTYLLHSMFLDKIFWDRNIQDGIVVYEKEPQGRSLLSILENVGGKEKIATYNLKNHDMRKFPVIDQWLYRRTSSTVSLKGRHTFLAFASRDYFEADFSLKRVGSDVPSIYITSQSGHDLFQKSYNIPSGLTQKVRVKLQNLPPGTPLNITVNIGDDDVIEGVTALSPYLMVEGNVHVADFINQKELELYTRGTRGISVRAVTKDALQNTLIDGKTFKIDEEQYTFIKGQLDGDNHILRLKKPDVVIGTESFIAFTPDDLQHYQFLHLPQVSDYIDPEDVDIILGGNIYESPQKDSSGFYTIHRAFDTEDDFVNSDTAAFSFHAAYPASSQTLPVRIMRGVFKMQKDPWNSDMFLKKIKTSVQQYE